MMHETLEWLVRVQAAQQPGTLCRLPLSVGAASQRGGTMRAVNEPRGYSVTKTWCRATLGGRRMADWRMDNDTGMPRRMVALALG